MEQLRAFIAVELPEKVKEALRRLIVELHSIGLEGIRWVNPEGIHLTLKFLGNVPADRVDPIAQVLSRCAAPFAPFELALADVGAFPNLRSPRVLWVGLGGALKPLLDLQGVLEQELQHLGFARESRHFSPHLTLGRVREGTPPHQRRTIEEALARMPIESTEAKERIPVEEISLIRSTLTPSGAVYTRLSSAPLEGTS